VLKSLEFSLIIGGQPVTGGVKVEAFSVNRGEIFRLEQPRPGTRPGKDIVGLVMQGGAAYRSTSSANVVVRYVRWRSDAETDRAAARRLSALHSHTDTRQSGAVSHDGEDF